MTRPPILVALDTPTAGEALDLAAAVAPWVAGFKVGLELLMGPGPSVIGDLSEFDRPVFADAKLHDIPNTVARAARQLGEAGARWVTVHASGGPRMMEAAVTGLSEGSEGRPAGILAVTVLTSFDDLEAIGVPDTIPSQVRRLASMAADSGVEGAVCSAQEIQTVTEAAPELIRVVPGIRPAGSDHHDQARVATPAQALSAGADYLVIGRAITTAVDPAAAASQIGTAILERGPDGG